MEFCLAEHVVNIGCRKLHTDNQLITKLTGNIGLKHRVRVKFKERGECSGGRVVSYIQLVDHEHDGLVFRARVTF
jgi:hypothetical protein